ncbi:hypothetical protein MesoLjLb_57260 [Mesorhizobium sp. L-8-3]|nr:hypothetical protein MesoLjLb_57260 [Mesorhizobium sp. L-8-3]
MAEARKGGGPVKGRDRREQAGAAFPRSRLPSAPACRVRQLSQRGHTDPGPRSGRGGAPDRQTDPDDDRPIIFDEKGDSASYDINVWRDGIYGKVREWARPRVTSQQNGRAVFAHFVAGPPGSATSQLWSAISANRTSTVPSVTWAPSAAMASTMPS